MEIKGLLSSIKNSVHGMNSQSSRLELVSQNIAHADQVARNGEPVYRKKSLVTRTFQPFARKLRESLIPMKQSDRRHIDRSSHIKRDEKQMKKWEIKEEENVRQVYDPSHPYADENGYIRQPDINVVEEMVDLMSLRRTYEANVQVFNSTKDMAKKALDI